MLAVIVSGGGIIGVTEPRRVAAISMSRRVAQEMALTTRYVLGSADILNW